MIQYNDVINELKKCCKKRELGEVYAGLEVVEESGRKLKSQDHGTKFFVDPMPPVDLVAVKTEDEPAGERPSAERKTPTLYSFLVCVTR